MTSKACWYCGGLPKTWWWLAALIGLPLLFFFMISDRQGPVESDLTDRVREELINKEAYWAEVNLDERGRDVMLSGAAPDEASRDSAIETVQNVYGVRTVEHSIEILPLRSPELSLQNNAGMVTLKGLLPTQGHIDSTVTAAGEAFGADKVDNQLAVGERLKESDWIAKMAGFMPALAAWKTATFDINDDGSKLSGIARTDAAKGDLLQQAKQLIGGKLEDGITVKPLQAATFATAMAAGKLTLDGLVPSQQNADSLVDAAAQRLGANNVINQLKVSDDVAEPSWLSQAQKFLGSLTNSDTSANIEDGKLTLAGTVNSYQAHINAIGSANAAIAGSELALQDNIAINIPKQAAAEYAIYKAPPPAGQVSGSIADGKLTLTGTLANQQEVDAIVAAANARVGEENVINQLQVSDKHSAASWLDNAKNLLLGLPGIKGMMSINDQQAAFSGTTETNEDYLAAIRKARMAMQGQQLAFENNVTLDKSRLEKEAAEKAEQERLAKEAADKAEQERLAKEAADKAEQERLAKEAAEKAEQERLAKEAAEKAEQERLAKEAAEKAEQERLAKEAAEKAEQERLAKEAAEKAEQERLAKEAAEKATQEKLARQKAEQQQACQASLNQTMQGNKILFETNKADLKTESFDLLFELASIVNNCEDALAGKVLSIGGHTDSDGKADYNADLSLRRASTIQAYLQNAGINTDLLEAKGYGEEQPVADNDTEEGKAQNRRITFEIRGQ